MTTTTDKSRADALTAQEALAAIETFEIVGENNDSREPNDEDRFILTEFIAHAFDGYDVEQHEAAPADALTDLVKSYGRALLAQRTDEAAAILDCIRRGDAVQTDPAMGSMTLAERIAHVGGRITDGGYVEFGSAMAIDALIKHVLRDVRVAAQAAPLEGTGNGADVRALLTTDGYFVYDRAGGHVEFYDTDAERDAAHREAIAEYRRDAQHDQEWPPEVEGIVSGVVTHITGELNIHEDGYEFEPRAVNFHAHAPRTVVAGAVPQPIGMHDVTTSAGGRSYIAEFFAKRLFRHDFGRYINERLAADFACALAKYLMEHDTSLSADAAAAPENCAHDYVRSDRVCIECGEQPEEPAADERAAFDYDDVVSICDAHGIGLPVDCIEMVVEIMHHSTPPAQVATRQGLTDEQRAACAVAADLAAANGLNSIADDLRALLDGDKR
ncbi:hypothetical protein BLA18628_03331 [Burkholderia aenigmatica]|uniref:hypothetical protein n=1 Tax=Burkholderia aenigmatica TaxID=2015348 RepID=UPI00145401BA|nr:hypothetical protein [Burkholderia aenigmatica]VWD12898.1 hypothetical protein BLA18628_03331 [Burkholderia aenigmatica]